jgi:ribonuclease R
MKQVEQNLQHSCIYYKNNNGMGGFAIDKNTKMKIKVLEANENFALEHDEVIVIEDAEYSGVRYGRITEITKHNTQSLSGTIQYYKDKLLLKVSNPKFGSYLVYLTSNLKKIERDLLYNCVITAYPGPNKPYFEAELANTVGAASEDEQFVQKILRDANLPIEFPAAVVNFTQQIKENIDNHDLINRVDLRHLPFVTIDGKDAKDFDDAVYCDQENGIFELYVAIADVAHYVPINSVLDQEAKLRGNSVYLPKMVIPMLPEKLSNGLCSLNPHVDRLVICCQMSINQAGDILKYDVYNAVIHSAARLTYLKVQEWIDEFSLCPPELITSMTHLYLAYQALLLSRETRGAIDFDTIEPMFIFDANGVVNELQPRVRTDSHKLIEECMLAANVCVADYLIKNKQISLFRIHGKPSIEKFAELKNFLNSLAVKFDVKYEQLTPHDYSKLLKDNHENPKFAAIQQAVLKSMQLAIYSTNNIGHFGLSYSRYLHFTSPIRRYPDLIVHRAIKAVINKNAKNLDHELSEIGEHTSFTERRAEDIERKISAFYKCQYAKSHIGNEYPGLITNVVNFGAFVYIPNLMLDGLIHVTELGQDYFIFDEKSQVLVGKKTGFRYYSGQELNIQIARVDMAKLFIDLKLVVK